MKLSIGLLAIAQARPGPWWREAAKVFSVSNLSSDSFQNAADNVSRNSNCILIICSNLIKVPASLLKPLWSFCAPYGNEVQNTEIR